MTSASASTRPTAVTLDVRRPYDAESMLDFLRHRAVAGIESVDGRGYARTMLLPGGPAVMQLEIGDESIDAHLWLSAAADLDAAVRRCRWLLDLDTDVAAAESHLGTDPRLAASIIAHPGLRVPGHVDGFEVAVRAVVGQQISVAGARTILGRLVSSYGDDMVRGALAGGLALTRLFPSPPVMAGLDPEGLPMPRSRGRALVAIAAAVAAGDLVLDRGGDLEETRRCLLAVPGIGPWTADYIALRALGDRDVFMASDLGVRHGLARMGLGAAGPEVFQAWSPWRSYALMHVWKHLDQEPA
jgi:AraC family transcriptional regulator, regulatory protein of adaptative response / DNA-3-methyladenine glycosylase II